jgi:hypothetical protein
LDNYIECFDKSTRQEFCREIEGDMFNLRVTFAGICLLLFATLASAQVGQAGATSQAAVTTDTAGGSPPAAPQATPSPTPNYSDDKVGLQIVGGVEQAGIASANGKTNMFLSVFTSANATDSFKLWGRIRLLGEAQASTGGVISAFQDPSGQIKNLDTQKVGQAVDFVLGPAIPIYPWRGRRHQRYSIELIAGVGATTPLSSEDVVSKFAVPSKSSPQCAEVITKFTPQNGYPANLILPDPSGTNCLANGITVLAFNNQERTSFLRRYGFGIRTINRFHPEGDESKCCENGVVDFAVGQDEAITGGRMRGWVFRVDGVHPLPIKDKNILYIFGTAALRINRNQDLRTIILDPDTSNATPSSPNVALLPLEQPNKDFYRFGVGLDIKQLFTKLFNGS